MSRKNTKVYKKRRQLKLIFRVSCFTLMLGLGILGFCAIASQQGEKRRARTAGDMWDRLNVSVDLLTPNEYSRPQTELSKVNGVVIHYTANPGTSAEANRNYFEGLKKQTGNGTSVSSHFVVGLKGEIIQCIPTWEVSYASNDRNGDTISIECCHPDETGKFNKKTYNSLVDLTAFLCMKYNLGKDQIIRHYDITGKDCPRYFVAHEDKWEQFKKDVFKRIEEQK